MSVTIHTPGPWKFECEWKDSSAFEVLPEKMGPGLSRGPWIATVHGEVNDRGGFVADAEARANAHLIAAAPELLAALKGIVPGECPIVTHHRPDCVWCEALKAIAKAEVGE